MWNIIKNKKDIENLIEIFGNFHDSCLKELHMWTDHYVDEELSMHVNSELDTHVRMLFQRQYENPSAIELLFEEVTGIEIYPSTVNYVDIILDAKIIYKDDIIYWAASEEWTPEESEDLAISWIGAKKVKWRDVSFWMGPQVRYGPKD